MPMVGRVRSKPVERCLIEFCDEAAYTRGLCINCYNLTYKNIKLGKTTDEAEVKAGRMKPRKQ